MARLRRWLDFNRPVLVLCAGVLAAIGTDLASGPPPLRYLTEIPVFLVLLIVFVWRLGHLTDDDEELVERHADFHEPKSNARIRRDE